MNHSRKFRKLIAAVLSVLCIVLCCTACGGNSNKPTPRPQNTAPAPGTTELNTTPAATDARTTDGRTRPNPALIHPQEPMHPTVKSPPRPAAGRLPIFGKAKLSNPRMFRKFVPQSKKNIPVIRFSP